MQKNVQIPTKLFLKLFRYFCLDDIDQQSFNSIKKDLESKIDSMVKHDLYTKSKTASTDEEREKARKEYLDLIGMRDSFRW